MDTKAPKDFCAKSQKQLALMREEFLSLMEEDMKVLRNYLSELWQVRRKLKKELKKMKCSSTDANISDCAQIAMS